jgi:hypothetical protein
MIRCHEVVAALRNSPALMPAGTENAWKIGRLRGFGYGTADATDLLAQLDATHQPEPDVAHDDPTSSTQDGTLDD